MCLVIVLRTRFLDPLVGFSLHLLQLVKGEAVRRERLVGNRRMREGMDLRLEGHQVWLAETEFVLVLVEYFAGTGQDQISCRGLHRVIR